MFFMGKLESILIYQSAGIEGMKISGQREVFSEEAKSAGFVKHFKFRRETSGQSLPGTNSGNTGLFRAEK
jgi:hypothetical protein